VIAPFSYAPLSLASPAVTAAVSNADVAGAYKMVDHGKDISPTIKLSQNVRLEADGTISGAATGSWIHRGDNLVELTVGATTFHGVLSRQWNHNAGRFTVTFSATAQNGV